MRRFHLFEFNDQAWLPSFLRRDIRRLLQYQIIHYGFYDAAIPVLADMIQRHGITRLIDFCAGEGDVTCHIQHQLAQIGCDVEILITDLYPTTSPSNQHFNDPVDARCPPPLPHGMWTFFTSFHHFKPHEAAVILKNATDAGAPVGIFEFTERTHACVLGSLLSPITVWIDTPHMDLSWFIKLRMMLLLPLLYGWDALVSHLRTYAADEFLAEADHVIYWVAGEEMLKNPTS